MWAKLKQKVRSAIYPRKFDVTIVDALTGKKKRLQFNALDKSEDKGRFSGDCVETITIDHDSFIKNFTTVWWTRISKTIDDTVDQFFNWKNQINQ